MAGPTVEMGVRLPVASFMAAGKGALAWEGVWRWEVYGEEVKLGFRADRTDDGVTVTVAHRGRQMTDDGGGMQRYKIMAVSEPMRFGGVRWYWICPSRHRRVTSLFLPLGARQFRSRHVYRLAYATQRMSPMERARTKLRRQNRRLGGDGDIEIPDKPKWMRWATYDRKVEMLEPLADRVDNDFLMGVARLLGTGYR